VDEYFDYLMKNSPMRWTSTHDFYHGYIQLQQCTRACQAVLEKRGFYHGHLNGILDERTKSSIRSYFEMIRPAFGSCLSTRHSPYGYYTQPRPDDECIAEDYQAMRRIIQEECYPNLIRTSQMLARAPWLEIAWQEYGKYKGIKETAEPLASRIREYFSITNQPKYGPEREWCAAFVNWCMIQAGYGIRAGYDGERWTEKSVERPAHVRYGWWPDSWANGEDHGKPFVGAIAVIRYSERRGHVGFVVGEVGDKFIALLGGNQRDTVLTPPGVTDGHYISVNKYATVSYYMKPKGYVVRPEQEVLPAMNIFGAGERYENTR